MSNELNIKLAKLMGIRVVDREGDYYLMTAGGGVLDLCSSRHGFTRETVAWKNRGGYGSQGEGRGRQRQLFERLEHASWWGSNG